MLEYSQINGDTDFMADKIEKLEDNKIGECIKGSFGQDHWSSFMFGWMHLFYFFLPPSTFDGLSLVLQKQNIPPPFPLFRCVRPISRKLRAISFGEKIGGGRNGIQIKYSTIIINKKSANLLHWQN
jgi:hypothetical protein